MRVRIRDLETLRSIRPLDLISYLRQAGWKKIDSNNNKFSVWELAVKNGGSIETIVPLINEFGDFGARMADVLSSLEAAENRSQIDIIKDIASTTVDVIRIKPDTERTSDGTISLEGGVVLVGKASEVMLAAACSTVAPRSFYPTRKPQQANDYLKRIRLGQTEFGSYVITIRSPIPPELKQTRDYLPDMEPEPFERQVTQTLSRALGAMNSAAARGIENGDLTPFQEAVKLGVSANLCGAVADLQSETESNTISFNISWAHARPLKEPLMKSFSFSPDTVEVIREAARIFKETAPRDHFDLEGHVIRLDKNDPDKPGPGIITFAVLLEEERSVKKIRTELTEEDYRMACDAHRDGLIVKCTGKLVREGRSYRLQSPHDFEVIDEIGD